MRQHTLAGPNTERDRLFAEIADLSERATDRTALLDPDRFAFSYGQAWRMIEGLRSLLEAESVFPHEVVAVVLPDALCGLLSTLGVARTCACAPMNPALTEAELEKDLVELGAVALLVAEGNTALGAVGARLGLLVVASAIRAEGGSWRVQTAAKEAGRRRISLPDGTTLLLHTSATTGRRKVVPLTDGNLLAMLGSTSRALRLQADDRLLLMAKLFHIQGILGCWAQLRAGGCVIAGLEYSPLAFQRCVATLSPTWYTGGPTLHRAILANLGPYPIPRPSSLRFARSGGALLAPELASALEQALGVPVLDVYGLTEVGGVASSALDRPQTEGTATPRPVGRSTGPEIAAMRGDGDLAGVGEEGQIVVRGPNVMRGYVNDPEANRDAYRDGWFLTGDLGHLDRDGFLYITGRMKEIINRGGQKIVPDEIDAVLAGHEAIREVAAFSVAHASLGEDVACAIVVREGFQIGDEELRAFAAKRLSTYKLPRMIVRMDAIPRGATGKPKRLLLSERFSKPRALSPRASGAAGTATATGAGPLRARRSGRSAFATPTDLAESLADVWRSCLRLEHVDMDDDFFAVGGDSISAVTMLMEVESLFSSATKIPDGRFFRSPTLATLYALAVEAMAGQKAVPVGAGRMEIVPVAPRAGQRTASVGFYMVPSDGAEGFCFRELARQIKPDWSLSLLRPANLWHERSARSVEDAAEQAAARVLAECTAETCVIGGFCYGGVVAFETARVLEQHGRRCLLLLFDVPTPGFPRPVRDMGSVSGAFLRTVRSSLRLGRIRPVLGVSRRLMRRVAWFAVRRMRPEGAIWTVQPMRWISGQAREGYFSFVQPAAIGAPILHVMATDAQDPLLEASRHAWERFAGGGMKTVVLPGTHDTIFSRSNVPLIVSHLSEWLQRQRAGGWQEGRGGQEG